MATFENFIGSKWDEWCLTEAAKTKSHDLLCISPQNDNSDWLAANGITWVQNSKVAKNSIHGDPKSVLICNFLIESDSAAWLFLDKYKKQISPEAIMSFCRDSKMNNRLMFWIFVVFTQKFSKNAKKFW